MKILTARKHLLQEATLVKRGVAREVELRGGLPGRAAADFRRVTRRLSMAHYLLGTPLPAAAKQTVEQRMVRDLRNFRLDHLSASSVA
jgi:hypothetical protein